MAGNSAQFIELAYESMWWSRLRGNRGVGMMQKSNRHRTRNRGRRCSLTACSESPEEALADRWPMLEQYCTECHSDAEAAGDMSLEGITPAEVAANPEKWERSCGACAAASCRRPAASTLPRAGQRVRRRGRSEPRRGGSGSRRGAGPRRVAPVESRRVRRRRCAICSDVDVDASRLLPPDATSDGFDNVAEVLRVSPTYLDQYIAAARDISIKAVGNPTPEPARAEYVSTTCESHRARRRFAARHARRSRRRRTIFRRTANTCSTCSVSSEPGAELRAYPQRLARVRAHGR